uniref:(northern house mosquito) hypothetical protein n=1 Tax=Culex pipiens TaxID=7175 RepID=A0A8D8HLH6_CULPI
MKMAARSVQVRTSPSRQTSIHVCSSTITSADVWQWPSTRIFCRSSPRASWLRSRGAKSRSVSSWLLDPQPISRVKNFDSKVVVGVCTNLGCVPTQTLEPLTTTFTDP